MIKRSNDVQKKQDFSFTEDKRQGATCYFTLKGRVSLNEASYMESKLEEAVKSGCTHIIINMLFVNIFTSAGIRVILAMYKKLKKMGGKLQIESPSENVRNVLGMTALDEMLL